MAISQKKKQERIALDMMAEAVYRGLVGELGPRGFEKAAECVAQNLGEPKIRRAYAEAMVSILYSNDSNRGYDVLNAVERHRKLATIDMSQKVVDISKIRR